MSYNLSDCERFGHHCSNLIVCDTLNNKPALFGEWALFFKQIIYSINNFKNFGSASSHKISKLIDFKKLFLQKIFQGVQLQSWGCAPFFHSFHCNRTGKHTNLTLCRQQTKYVRAAVSLRSPSESSQGISERYNLVCKQHMVV